MQVFKLPVLRDDTHGFNYLCYLAAQLKTDWFAEVDFSECRFLMQNGVAVLGGLARLAEHFGGRINFRWETLQPAVQRSLARNQFLPFFGLTGAKYKGYAVPFRHDAASNQSEIVHYLSNDWIATDRVNLSGLLRDLIVGKTWEIYANAFEHGQSIVGVFSCGQHYPQKKLLKLTVVDFGIGIPAVVNRHLRKNSKPELSAAAALNWAFTRGNSTKADIEGIARGLGLDLLREFVRINKGRLEVFSYDGYARVDTTQAFSTRSISFPGTVVNITFSCDESYYRLASEAMTARPLF